MKLASLITLSVILLPAPAFAGPACEALAQSVQKCSTLDLPFVIRCIRIANETGACAKLEGPAAANDAIRPGLDAYTAARIEEHKRLYGQ